MTCQDRVLSDVEFRGEYQRFLTQSSNIDRYRSETHCFVGSFASSRCPSKDAGVLKIYSSGAENAAPR